MIIKTNQTPGNDFHISIDEPPPSSASNGSDSLLEEDKQDRKSDRSLREKMATLSYNIAQVGLTVWIAVLVLYVQVKIFSGTKLFSDNVLIAITTAVTVNTFTSFVVVVKGLFPKK
jgi:hypothetical protein